MSEHRLEVTDEMVSAALAVWYPGEWPDDPVFLELNCHGVAFRDVSIEEMRATLEAAIAVMETTP